MSLSQSNWLSKQLKSYISASIPSWGNFSNNPMSRNAGTPSVTEKPAYSTNFISVIPECIIQTEDFADPFTVKTLRI